MATPFAACLRADERLECAERVDPAGHAMHVAAAVAWGFAQSVSNAAEGITWGVLLVVSVLRIPKVWRCFAPVVRDPLWLSLLGWSLWMCASMAWSAAPPSGLKPWFPDRWVLTPLLLWPAMGRPWVVLGAIGAGALVQVASALVLSPGGGDPVRALSGFGQLQWHLHCAVALCAAGARAAPGWSGILPSAGLAAALWAVALAERRLTALSSVAAMALAFLRPSSGAWRRRSVVVAALIIAAASTVVAQGIARRLGADAATGEPSESRYVRINDLIGNRLSLAHAAIELGGHRPVMGNGAGSFRALAQQWAISEGREHPERRGSLGPLRSGRLNDAHNALLNAFAEGGIPATALLGTALLGLGVRLWRQSAASPTAGAALAVYSSILLGMLCYPITAKAPGAIIAVCLAVSWSMAPVRLRPRASGTP